MSPIAVSPDPDKDFNRNHPFYPHQHLLNLTLNLELFLFQMIVNLLIHVDVKLSFIANSKTDECS